MRRASVKVRLVVLVLGLALGGGVWLRVAHQLSTTWTVDLAGPPTAAVVDARGGRAFIAADGVAAGSAGYLLTLDTATGTVLHAVTLDYDPRGVALDAVRVRVVVVNAATLDSSGSPGGPGSVSILDEWSGQPLRAIRLDASTSAVAIDARTGRALITEGQDPYRRGILVSFDPVAGRVVWTTTVGTYPTAVAVDSGAGHAFVANMLDNTVEMLDTRSGRVLRTTVLGAAPGTVAALADDAATGHLFAESFPARIAGSGGSMVGHVAVLDAASGGLLRTVTLDNPMTLAVDARTGRVLVGSVSQVSVLDGTDGRLLWSVLRDLPAPVALVTGARAGGVLAVSRGDGRRVSAPDPWAWILGWARQRLPFLTAPPTPSGDPRGSVTLLNLPLGQ